MVAAEATERFSDLMGIIQGKEKRGFQRQLTPTKASMGVMCQPAICAFENFPRESIVAPSIEL